MKVEKGIMVPLGYGKFFRSEKLVGLEPVEEGRGPGRRTKVYVEALSAPVIASRSEGADLHLPGLASNVPKPAGTERY